MLFEYVSALIANQHQRGGLHYAHARYLNTDLRIFLSVDPLFMKYPGLTPYNYCGNNPVMRVDPTGMYFDEENNEEAKFLTFAINVKIQGLSFDKKAREKNSVRISELEKSLQDIKDMAADDSKEYRFTHDENKDVGIYCDNMINDKGDDVIVMNSTSMDSKIHESRHGGQIARKELDPSCDGNYGVEIDAYRAQFGYGGSIQYYSDKWFNMRTDGHEIGLTPSTLVNYSQINKAFINSIIEKNGKVINHVYNFNEK